MLWIPIWNVNIFDFSIHFNYKLIQEITRSDFPRSLPDDEFIDLDVKPWLHLAFVGALTLYLALHVLQVYRDLTLELVDYERENVSTVDVV